MIVKINVKEGCIHHLELSDTTTENENDNSTMTKTETDSNSSTYDTSTKINNKTSQHSSIYQGMSSKTETDDLTFNLNTDTHNTHTQTYTTITLHEINLIPKRIRKIRMDLREPGRCGNPENLLVSYQQSLLKK